MFSSQRQIAGFHVLCTTFAVEDAANQIGRYSIVRKRKADFFNVFYLIKFMRLIVKQQLFTMAFV